MKRIIIALLVTVGLHGAAAASGITYLTQERSVVGESEVPAHVYFDTYALPCSYDGNFAVPELIGIEPGWYSCTETHQSDLTGTFSGAVDVAGVTDVDVNRITARVIGQQDSNLGAGEISFLSSVTFSDTLYWGSGSSSIDTVFTLQSATQFRIQGLLRADDDPYGFGGCCASLGFILESAGGGETFLEDSDFVTGVTATDLESFDDDLVAWASQIGQSYTYFDFDPSLFPSYYSAVDTVITLGPGTYHLSASTDVLSCGAEDRESHYFCGDFGSRSSSAMGFKMSVVPVPPALLLFPSALAVLGWCRRRRLAGDS